MFAVSLRIASISLGLSLLITNRLAATFAQDDRSSDSIARPVAPTWATLVGSAERNKYHRPACGNAQKIKAENVIWFVDANDATENGYVAAACNDKKCRPPQPDSAVEPGPIGGRGFPPPDPNPPTIPKPIEPSVAASSTADSKKAVRQPTSSVAKAAKANSQPPPRLAVRRNVDPQKVWQDITPQRELAARQQWHVWYTWALERWCERWHVNSSGSIDSKTAYGPDAERELMAQFNAMKDMIDKNKKRMTELDAIIAGKNKKK
jgi:hypothetical protein